MICVVDASVAVKWFAQGAWAQSEDHRDSALELLQASGRGDVQFYQPSHFVAEMAAVLVRLLPARAWQDLQLLRQLDIRHAEPWAGYPTALTLAAQLQHPLFDTLYHALALDTPGATFVTADRRYYDKAHALGSIVWLPEWSVAG